MKIAKRIAIGILVYAVVVATFETLLGIFQPMPDSTLVITTSERDGTSHERVLAHLESEGKLYVAANHWPRAWYDRALANPHVQVTIGSETGDYQAVPVSGAERDRVDDENSLGIAFRVLTGFPPRLFLRLDPREPS
jgi:hypothetical protein